MTVDSFTPNDDGTSVTATFRVPPECGSVRLALATYARSPDGTRTRLHASTSTTVVGDSGTHTLSVDGPGCDLVVALVVGDAKGDPNDYSAAQIVDSAIVSSFRNCAGFEDTTTSSTSTSTTTTTRPPATTASTTTTTTGDAPACPGGDPSERLEPGGSRVDLTATRATATFTVRPGCDNQAVLAIGRPDRDVFTLIDEGRYVTTGESGITGPACGVGDQGTPAPGLPALPFTGTALIVPLLAGGLTLLAVGAVTLLATRRRRGAPRP